MAEEKLQVKMEQSEENRQAYLTAMVYRLQERVRIKSANLKLIYQIEPLNIKEGSKDLRFSEVQENKCCNIAVI